MALRKEALPLKPQIEALYIASLFLVLQGIGSKVLKRSGWVVGSGVGATNQGITEPVASDGQHPSNKKGLGYVCDACM